MNRGRAGHALQVLLLLAALLLAGCTRPGGGGGSDGTDGPEGMDGSDGDDGPSGPDGPPPLRCDDVPDPDMDLPTTAEMDGDRILDDIITLLDLPGDRVPGRDGQRVAACWLRAAMALPGWTVTVDGFTGADYQALDKGSAAPWASCGSAEEERVAKLPFYNLIATHAATDAEGAATTRVFAMGAHWDAKATASQDPDPDRRGDPVPGADDGASGVAVLLEWMRHVSRGDVLLRMPVTVVFFDGEDGFEDCHPLAGSLRFVAVSGDDVDRFLLLDMVGDADARFVREAGSEDADPGLMDLVWHHGAAVGRGDNFLETRKAVVDDHLPFLDAGIPAVDLIDYGRDTPTGFPPFWHTTQDTPDQLEADMLGDMAAMLEGVVEDPGFLASWPSR